MSARRWVILLYVGLAVANGLAWLGTLALFQGQPVLIGASVLAYTLGLRHAVDADHIAAIDSVTRKLMQTGRKPLTTGLFFSLGHSTVVIAASAAVALGAATLDRHFGALQAWGGLIGAGVSAVFLLAIGAANLVVLAGVVRTFGRVRAGLPYVEEDLDLLLANRGPLARLCRRLFQLVRASWQMYPLGLLFGLGFDTATEIGVLGISASSAHHGLAIWTILIFPALFTAGMSLVDTTDSILMVGAYGWALDRPIRKLYYNLAVTSLSVLVAFAIGSVEVLGIIGRAGGANAGLWVWAARLEGRVGSLGWLVIALFLLSWAVAVVVYRLNGADRAETASR